MAAPRKYPEEVRQRAVRMVMEWRREHDQPRGGCTQVAQQLGVNKETLRNWVTEAEQEGVTGALGVDERDELKALRRENAELRRANEILKSASALFAAEIDRPQRR
jgi:transposase